MQLDSVTAKFRPGVAVKMRHLHSQLHDLNESVNTPTNVIHHSRKLKHSVIPLLIRCGTHAGSRVQRSCLRLYNFNNVCNAQILQPNFSLSLNRLIIGGISLRTVQNESIRVASSASNARRECKSRSSVDTAREESGSCTEAQRPATNRQL